MKSVGIDCNSEDSLRKSYNYVLMSLLRSISLDIDLFKSFSSTTIIAIILRPSYDTKYMVLIPSPFWNTLYSLSIVSYDPNLLDIMSFLCILGL